jgi:benzoyl-CoA reductase/2-hydroxyglutaryl-CoA dehydratase subunit BcrC/BadD/HgdB
MFFIIHRTKQQLARFIELATKDPSELTMEDKEILRSQYTSYYADTDEEKLQLVQTMQQLHDYINSLA